MNAPSSGSKHIELVVKRPTDKDGMSHQKASHMINRLKDDADAEEETEARWRKQNSKQIGKNLSAVNYEFCSNSQRNDPL